MSKGKDPKGPVRQGSRRNWSALISGWSNAKRNPHAIIGTHQNAHTTHPTVGEKWWDTFAFKHTGKAGEEKHCKETVAIKSYARKEFNCVLDGGHATTFSERPTSREIAWTPTKQFRVRYFRNGETHVRSRKREQDHRKEIFTKDTEMIAIRTLLLTRICINSGEQARVAAWDLHKHMYKILGTYQENKRSLKQRLSQEEPPKQKSTMKKQSL